MLNIKKKNLNGTIQEALETGISEGENLIVVNGSNTSIEMGNYGTDYLMRAAVAKYGLFGNSPEEAVYTGTFVDSQGQNLTGTNSYVMHFDKGQTPPVNALWSLTMYDNASRLVDNPIDRYSISDRTPGIKFNEDGSLDIYIQHDNPGPDKESNWLPAPEGEFSMNLRLYVPQESVLNGEYQYPPVQKFHEIAS